MRLGLVDSMELDRVHFVLTMVVKAHPGEAKLTVVERFSSEAALLARYDELVAQEAIAACMPTAEDVLKAFGSMSGEELDHVRSEFRDRYTGPWATGGIIPPGKFGLFGEQSSHSSVPIPILRPPTAGEAMSGVLREWRDALLRWLS